MIFQRDLLFANFQGTVLVRDACFSNVTLTNGCPSLDFCKKNAFGGFHLGGLVARTGSKVSPAGLVYP